MSRNVCRTAARLAWRDLKASPSRSLLVSALIAVNIAAVGAVYASASLARRTLGRDSRIWLGGDVAAETSEPVGDDQMAALDALRRQGIDWTLVSATLTVAASAQTADPVAISIKAIDPAVYPFYGAITLQSRLPIRSILQPDTIVVSDQVLNRLRVHAGDWIRVGGQHYRIVGAIAAEPERQFGIFEWGPRGVVSTAGFQRLGAASAGNWLMRRIVLRLPPGITEQPILEQLGKLFPDARTVDYRDSAAPEVARLELAISFMAVVSFLTLFLGALGVAAAMRLNLEQRIPMFAILRVIGATTAQMAALFLCETAATVIAGLVLGLPLAYAIRQLLLTLAANYLPFPTVPAWDHAGLLESGLAALAISAPLLAGPANALRRLKPMILLRRDVPESHVSIPGARLLLAGAIAIACLGAAAAAIRMVSAWKPALLLAGIVALSTGVAVLMAGAVLRLMRFACRVHLPLVIRHALLGFQRHGSRPRVVIVCLALGVMILSATFSSSVAVVRTVSAALPFQGGNLIVVDFEASRREQVRQFLEHQPGVDSVELLMRARLYLGEERNRPLILANCTAHPTESQGRSITIADDLAHRLNLHVGSPLELASQAGAFPVAVGRIYHPRPEERFWYAMTLDCAQLSPGDLFQAAIVRARPDRVETVRAALSEQFPTLPSTTTEDIDSTISAVTDDALALVRTVTWAAGVCGLMILAIVIAASRAQRLFEIGIFAALGATSKTMVQIYTFEFAVTGIIAGSIGSLLAMGLSTAVFSVLLHHAQLTVSASLVVGTLLISSLLAVGGGWLATYGLFQRKPLEILRNE